VRPIATTRIYLLIFRALRNEKLTSKYKNNPIIREKRLEIIWCAQPGYQSSLLQEAGNDFRRWRFIDCVSRWLCVSRRLEHAFTKLIELDVSNPVISLTIVKKIIRIINQNVTSSIFSGKKNLKFKSQIHAVERFQYRIFRKISNPSRSKRDNNKTLWSYSEYLFNGMYYSECIIHSPPCKKISWLSEKHLWIDLILFSCSRYFVFNRYFYN